MSQKPTTTTSTYLKAKTVPPPALAGKGEHGRSGKSKQRERATGGGGSSSRASSASGRSDPKGKSNAVADATGHGGHFSRADTHQSQVQAGRGRGRGQPSHTTTTPGGSGSKLSGMRFYPHPTDPNIQLVMNAQGEVVDQLHANQFVHSPSQAESLAPLEQFGDAATEEDFHPSPEAAKAAKKAAARKAREVEHAEFFKAGGTHATLHEFLQKQMREGKQAKAKKAPATNKRKHQAQTPTGHTPATKTPRTTATPDAPSGPDSYAGRLKENIEQRRKRAAAAAAAREANPFALYVYTGKMEKGSVTREHNDIFREALAKALVQNATSPNPVLLNSEFTNWNSRKLCVHIACKDEPTSKWFTDVIDRMEVNGMTFRAYPVAGAALGKANFNAKGLYLQPADIVKLMLANNPWLGSARLSSPKFVTVPHSKDDHVEIILSDEAAAQLGCRKWRVSLGTDMRMVHYYGRRELAQRLRDTSDPLYEQFQNVALREEGPAEANPTDDNAMDVTDHPVGDRGDVSPTTQEEEIIDEEGLLNSSPRHPA